MDWVERGGISLRYDVRRGGDLTLVLVHEMGGTLESWDQVVPLIDARVTVVRYDTRGAGLSTKLRGVVAIADMAADIGMVLDAAILRGPVVLTGIAVGGAVAMYCAGRYPESVVGLIPFGPATGVGEDRRASTLARAEAIEAGGMMAIADAALAMSYPETLRGDRERFAALRARWLGNDPGSYAAILRMLASLDMDEDLTAIACPTVVLAGTDDLVRPPATVEAVARRVQGARFETIDSGHFASVQAPEQLAARLNAFLAEVGL